MSLSLSQSESTELFPEYAEYQKYMHFESSSSLFNAFENAESSQQYLDAPPSQKNVPQNYDISKSDYYTVSPQLNLRDPVALHFNVQTAIADSRGFHALSYQELEDLKKDLQIVETRLTDITHKLQMEQKLYDAAISISKLGSASLSSSASQRKSFLFNSSSSKEKKRLSKQADDEIEISKSKIDFIRKESIDLLRQKDAFNSRILQHHIAILALTHPGSESSSAGIFASTNKRPQPDARKSATQRMLSNKKSNSMLSPPASPQSSKTPLVNYDDKINKIVNKLHISNNNTTTTTSAQSNSDKLDTIYDLTSTLIEQLNHSKTSLNNSQQQTEIISNVLSELLHTMDSTKRIHPSQYKNPTDLQTTASRTLRQFENQFKDKIDECETNHSQLNESNHQLQGEIKNLQEIHDNLKAKLSERATTTSPPPPTLKLPTSPIFKTIEESAELDESNSTTRSTKVKSLLRQQVESLTASYEANRAELEKLELENVDLKTNLQETKFSTQAEIQQLKNELSANEERVQEWKERCDALHSELESVVRSLEDVTRQAVDYESERSKLERTVHDLQNELFQLSNTSLDRRVSMIGSINETPTSSNNNSPAKKSLLRISTVPEGIATNSSTEPLSVSLLRHEFRRITQEMNTKHMKEIKQIQSEKKKLEHLLRSIKTSSYMGKITPEQIQSLGVIEAN